MDIKRLVAAPRVLLLLALAAPPLGLSAARTATATFAGGCFWCMQPPFEKVRGVARVLAGYTGGRGSDVTYDNYAGKGYTEAVQITFDPDVVSYRYLVDVFWRQINPTDPEGQFVDRGPQYRAAIYVRDPEQRRVAEASRAALNASGRYDKPIVIKILPFEAFYPAEDYHQDYYRKSPGAYGDYRSGSGRDPYLDAVWGKDRVPPTPMPTPTAKRRGRHARARAQAYHIPGPAERRKMLSPLACHVTQDDGTEPAFDNAYWNNHAEGIYVDVVSGEPLFCSKDKFDSGTGWPSFTKPLDPGNIVTRIDHSFGLDRTEVRSKHADSHLGHLFDDGPAAAGGMRYCVNSAALRFIPRKDLAKDGYARYEKLFEK